MLKSIITKIIQKKNPRFQLDKAVTFPILFALVWEKMLQRIRSFRLLFAFKIPRQMYLGKGVRFFNLTNIQFGKWVQFGEGVYVSGLSKEAVVFGNNVSIGAFSRIVASSSFNNIGEYIRIGDHVGIGEFAYLGGGGGLEIGSDCIIGQYFSCHPENHNYASNEDLIRFQGVSRKGIRIGKNCWIGAKVTILDGVEIGNNCVIAAGAVVTKSMPADSVIGGVPAKLLKSRSNKNKIKSLVLRKVN